MNIALFIVNVHPDPLCTQRLSQGDYRINKELNDEWIDLQNQSEYTINLQKRVLVSLRQRDATTLQILKRAELNSPSPIPLYSGEKIRIFTGEQPSSSTHIPDSDGVNRVIWIAQKTYLWVPIAEEAQLYFSMEDLNRKRPPLARLRYRMD